MDKPFDSGGRPPRLHLMVRNLKYLLLHYVRV